MTAAVTREPTGGQGLREAIVGALIGQPVVRDYYTLPITPRDAHLLADALLPIVHRYADQRAAGELGEALGIGATRGPLEAAAWMARRHAALRQEVSR